MKERRGEREESARKGRRERLAREEREGRPMRMIVGVNRRALRGSFVD